MGVESSPERALTTTPLTWRSWPLLLGLALTCCLLLLHGMVWVRSVEVQGGLERYARLIDFTATLTGARLVRDGDGAALYDLTHQRAAQEQVLAPSVTLKSDTLLPYIHPPFEALLFAPLMSLPYATLYLLWSLLIIAACGGALCLLSTTIPVAPPVRWLLLLVCCSFSPLQQALWLGQSSSLVLLGLCGAYTANKRGREGWAGVALTLLLLKPQILLVVGLMLLLLGYWRTLAVCGGLVVGLCLATMTVLGLNWPLRYARFLAGVGNWQGNHNEYPAIMYNWRGLLMNLLGDARPGLLVVGVMVLTMLSLGLLCGAWWWSRSGAAQAGRQDVLWSLACLIAILSAPHLYIHDLVILLLPAWLIAARCLATLACHPAARAWLGALWCGYALAFSSLFRAEDIPAFPVVPGIVLIIALSLALLRQAFTYGEPYERRLLPPGFGKLGA